jgi:hypothetical protein
MRLKNWDQGEIHLRKNFLLDFTRKLICCEITWHIIWYIKVIRQFKFPSEGWLIDWFIGVLVRSMLHIVLVFCVVPLCVFTFWVPCCDVRYDFRIKMMFSSCIPPVICKRAHVLLTLFVFVCVKWCPTKLCCALVLFFFVLCILCSQFLWIVLFLIVPSVFSNVYI